MKYERMKKIQSQMEDELEGAWQYAKCAVDLKETDKQWADQYYMMAQQEYQHMNTLHSLAVAEIRKLEAEGDSSYSTMKDVYDYLHERMMDKAAEVQAMMNMYKG